MAALQTPSRSPAHLFARPRDVKFEGVKEIGPPGLIELPVGRRRRALLHVPKSSIQSGSAALAVMLHGANGSADHGLSILAPYAENADIIVLAPQSRQQSWDIISDRQYGADVQLIEECLQFVFSRYNVDPLRVALGGFSDGASYALSLGLSNGHLFTHLLAFSPGFMAPAEMEGSPSVFMCHGTRDEVLPINRCSRRLVPVFQSYQLHVEYREFEGAHVVPDEGKARGTQFLIGA